MFVNGSFRGLPEQYFCDRIILMIKNLKTAHFILDKNLRLPTLRELKCQKFLMYPSDRGLLSARGILTC